MNGLQNVKFFLAREFGSHPSVRASVHCWALNKHTSDLTGWGAVAPRSPGHMGHPFHSVLTVCKPSVSPAATLCLQADSPQIYQQCRGRQPPLVTSLCPPPRRTPAALTTVCVPHDGDHRELPPPALPSQELPFPPESVQGLTDLHFPLLEETLLHLHERLPWEQPRG